MTSLQAGTGLAPADAALEALVSDRFASRLFRADATLWGAEAEAEASARLGWLKVFERGESLVAEALQLRRRLRSAGVDRVVLSGMGGSSLAPEVITRRDGVPLTILDSTHPAQVQAALADLERTALVVSSKSGSTVETRSHLATFELAYREAGIDPAARIVVVTDPGSALHEDSTRAGYRVFLADPDVGGRYSALTAFGLVPSVLAGADGNRVLDEASAAAPALRSDRTGNTALRLAATAFAQLPAAYTFGVGEAGDDASGLADWIEQLVAESSGKRGLGMLPIALPDDAPELWTPQELPRSMFLVELGSRAVDGEPGARTIRITGALGAQFLLWEVATTALCRLIGVNPFDQPDVESAKAAARATLSESGGDSPELSADRLAGRDLAGRLRELVRPDGYVAVQAYVDRSSDSGLGELRSALFEALRVPVALGYGPRYLHSTGQFHKGGPPRGVFVQILDTDPSPALAIPGLGRDFAELIGAQAGGDRRVLGEHGCAVLTMDSAEIGPAIDALKS